MGDGGDGDGGGDAVAMVSAMRCGEAEARRRCGSRHSGEKRVFV